MVLFRFLFVKLALFPKSAHGQFKLKEARKSDQKVKFGMLD